MGTHIEIDDARLFGRECTVEAYWGHGRAQVTIRMDGQDFTSEYDLTPELERALAQSQIELVTRAEVGSVRNHIQAIQMNGGRLPGPKIVFAAQHPKR